MLTAGQTNNVSFKVNVMGSSAEPTVRVVVAANPEMSFTATRDGDSWKAAINVPTSVAPGSYDLRVEVVLNNRLFTPLQKKVDVVGLEAPTEVPATVSMPAPEPVPEPTEPKVSLMTSIIGDEPTVEKKPAPEMPKVVGKMPKVEPKAAPKAEEVVVPPAPSLSKLAETAARPAKRMYGRVVTPLPQTAIEAKPISISISEVNAITSATTKKLVTKPVVEAKVKKNPTVRLIKEELFYE